jgi:hypothetical protein
MADFGIAFTYLTGANQRLVVADSALTKLWNNAEQISSRGLAVNREAGLVYANAGGVMKAYRLRDGTVMYTDGLAAVNSQMPIFVDGDNFLWSIDDTYNNKMYKWHPRLTSRTTYTIKSGDLDDDIRYIAMTTDMSSMYVVGGTDGVLYNKYDVDNLDGGASDWGVDVTYEMHFIVVDHEDHTYLCDLATFSGRIRHYDTDGGEIFGDAILGYGLPAVVANKLFVPTMTPDGVGSGAYKQLDTTDGVRWSL